MGRKKLAMKRIENATTRQVTYTKRKDGLVKKATELSVLCDTDVALVMFSPIGRLTSFASNGRVEDIFLRFVDRPDELRGGPISNEEYLSQKLKQLKNEAEMLEKIAMYLYNIFMELEEKLDKLSRRQREAQDKMRYYEPDVEKMSSALEAGVAQQFLTSAIERIQVSKAKLLGKQPAVPLRIENTEEEIVLHQENAASMTDQASYVNQNRMNSMRDEDHSAGPSLPPMGMGPHLSLPFIEAQRKFK
ncbi:hypothetical protein ACJIZ3_006901 [Penstemon smallii]|uniref:MADS-box domain-containing protein n=1 Tax=Penstemon smallii TaxID=265156 RepID=A0ABD3S988_9LAMI